MGYALSFLNMDYLAARLSVIGQSRANPVWGRALAILVDLISKRCYKLKS
jgi:hypothetical protein